MANYPVKRGKKEFKYVLCILDCFSRYLWLRPLQTKSSSEVVTQMKKIYQSKGHPQILQCDRGGEFKKNVAAYCRKHGIRQILSAPYHPQTQGKCERSHQSWRNKFYFDMRRSNYKFTHWVSRLQLYASLYNKQHHESLGTSPFNVYHGREPNEMLKKAARGRLTCCRRDLSSSVTHRLHEVQDARDAAKKSTEKSSTKMVNKHAAKYPPSKYYVGEKVFVKTKKGHKIHTGHIHEGFVLKANYRRHLYKVQFAGGVRWFSVSQMAAVTRDIDLAKRKTQRKRIALQCHCESNNCKKFADVGCTNIMQKKCCRSSLRKCALTKHSQRRLSVNDFVKTQPNISDFLRYIQMIESIPVTNTDATHDSLVANALALNLIPEGDIPTDGSCMFHACFTQLHSHYAPGAHR